jgi:hypothetical protein
MASDAVYRQGCVESSRKWRERNPGYWKQYRQKHPEAVARNRERQQSRDQKRRLRSLANDNLVVDLKSSPAEVWLIGPTILDLANNNLAPGKLLIFETVSHQLNLPTPACKQQLYGRATVFAR